MERFEWVDSQVESPVVAAVEAMHVELLLVEAVIV